MVLRDIKYYLMKKNCTSEPHKQNIHSLVPKFDAGFFFHKLKPTTNLVKIIRCSFAEGNIT